MKTLEKLLSKRWILKDREKELYYKIIDNSHKYKDFLKDDLGYNLIIHKNFVKLEKKVDFAKNWMGIKLFNKKMSYVFLIFILIFLEDKEEEDQFILSQLTEFIEDSFKFEDLDWTIYSNRLALIDALKFCKEEGILLVNDGNENEYVKNYESEILYENTGMSKYLMKNFANHIQNYKKIEDFREIDDTQNRKQRAYRGLLTNLAFYKDKGNIDEFNYIKYYRNAIKDNFSKYFDVDLHVHKNTAFLILGEDSNFGEIFPDDKTITNIFLAFNDMLLNSLKNNEDDIKILEYSKIEIKKSKFKELLFKVKNSYGILFSKDFRDKSENKFLEEIIKYLKEYDFLEENEEYYYLKSIVGKIIGKYPAELLEEKDDKK